VAPTLVACIGRRDLDPGGLELCRAIGRSLATAGHRVQTVGSPGACLAFAEGAARALQEGAPGGLALIVPWESFEGGAGQKLVRQTPRASLWNLEQSPPVQVPDVTAWHPAPDRLSDADKRIFAAYATAARADLIIAWPHVNRDNGTAFALHVASKLGVKAHNLSFPNIRRAYSERAKEPAPAGG
jgi:hypothetical protein